jgi:hypothetical protein
MRIHFAADGDPMLTDSSAGLANLHSELGDFLGSSRDTVTFNAVTGGSLESYPAVHSPGDGWLGPTPRSAGQCVVDAGKVSVWQCSDKSVFIARNFGCRLWLRFFDFDDS